MTNKSMILYDFNGKTSQEKTNIIRKLFGFKDKSNRGAYVYWRKGLLSEISHEQGYKRTLVVETEDAKEVVEILKKFNVSTVKVMLEKNDI